ncbi:MAG: hypothetical protein ACO1N5_00455 [Noviherbaspirillum sp.]
MPNPLQRIEEVPERGLMNDCLKKVSLPQILWPPAPYGRFLHTIENSLTRLLSHIDCIFEIRPATAWRLADPAFYREPDFLMRGQ